MTGRVVHPAWCSPDHCTVEPGGGGTHASKPRRRPVIAGSGIVLAVSLLKASLEGPLVVIVHVQLGFEDTEPYDVPLSTLQALDLARALRGAVWLADQGGVR